MTRRVYGGRRGGLGDETFLFFFSCVNNIYSISSLCVSVNNGYNQAGTGGFVPNHGSSRPIHEWKVKPILRILPVCCPTLVIMGYCVCLDSIDRFSSLWTNCFGLNNSYRTIALSNEI